MPITEGQRRPVWRWGHYCRNSRGKCHSIRRYLAKSRVWVLIIRGADYTAPIFGYFRRVIMENRIKTGKRKKRERYKLLAENMATINQFLLIFGWVLFFVIVPLADEGLRQAVGSTLDVEMAPRNWFLTARTFSSFGIMLILSMISWKLEVMYLTAMQDGNYTYAKNHLSTQAVASAIICAIIIMRCLIRREFLVPSFVLAIICFIDFFSLKKQFKEVQRVEKREGGSYGLQRYS